MGFEALYAGRDSRNPVWSGKEAHRSLIKGIECEVGIVVQTINHQIDRLVRRNLYIETGTVFNVISMLSLQSLTNAVLTLFM